MMGVPTVVPPVQGGVERYKTVLGNGELVFPGMRYTADLIPGQVLSLYEDDEKICTVELVDRTYGEEDFLDTYFSLVMLF